MNTSKTLLAILVEKLQKNGGWPKFDREMQVVQDYDGEVKFHFIGHALEFERNNPGTWGSNTPKAWLEDFAPQSNFFADLASDYSTAIITREQYEAALAAKNEGWIEWAGGECPVANHVVVDVKFRDQIDPVLDGDPAENFRWEHFGNSADIIAYRLHQPQDANSRANDDRLLNDLASREVDTREKIAAAEADLNDCIGQTQEDYEAIRADILGIIHDAGSNISIGDAFEITEMLIDAGYRKQ